MSSSAFIINYLMNILPLEIANKIIYEFKAIETPSARVINSLITKIYQKNKDIDKIILITPEYKCYDGEYIYKIWSDWGVWWGFRVCFTHDPQNKLNPRKCRLRYF